MNKQYLVGLLSLLAVDAFAFSPTINPTIGGGTPGGTNVSVGFALLSTNIEGPYFHAYNNSMGYTNPVLRLNSTNIIINSNQFHVRQTLNSPFLISTDGVFAGLRSGYQIENHGGTFDQMMILKVLSSTQAVVASLTLGYPSFPTSTISDNTNFAIRTPDVLISDDTIGQETFGSFIDANGMPWFNYKNDQGTIYFIDNATGNLITIGAANAVNVGLDNSSWGFAVSGLKTNGGVGGQSPSLQFFVHQDAPNESMVIMSNGVIAIGDGAGRVGGGITNRHPSVMGRYIPFWVGILQTNVENGTYVSLTNGNINASGTITLTSNSIPVAVTVGASAFKFTNTTASILYCNIGDTTSVTTSVGINGVTTMASTTDLNTQIQLKVNEYLTLTYSGGTPTLFTNK